MARASKLVAYQYKPDDFEYVLLADVIAAQSSEQRPRFTVEISVGSGKASIKQSDKELTGVVRGDWIRWECRLPFRLEFQVDQGPEGPGKPILFDSMPGKDLHFRTLNIGKLAVARLDYEIFVEAEKDRWLKVDPSIIIEPALARIFVPKLKDTVAFPPLASTRTPTKASAAKPAKKVASGKRAAKAAPRSKPKPSRKK